MERGWYLPCYVSCSKFKPSGSLFNAVAMGRMLILSPWEYDEYKRHITREECVALNGMAEEICSIGNVPE